MGSTTLLALLALAAASLQLSRAFVVQIPPPPSSYAMISRRGIRGPATASRRSTSTLFLSSSPEPRRSRIEGNQRDPTPQELEVMDEMITKLANAKPYELPNAVQRAFRVISSPQFFLRIAQRTDECADDDEKKKLEALASNLVSTLDAVVSTAEDKLNIVAEDVEKVVKAAAEPDSGEFLVPLTEERIAAMRKTLGKVDGETLEGDAFLSTVDAWMNKSHLDGMDGMVTILQKVLQMYAGRRILEACAASVKDSSSNENGQIFEKLLQTDADSWDVAIREAVSDADAAEALTREIQRNMEAIVLQLDSGSMAQQVQAEFLREMVKRVEMVAKTL